MTEQFDASLKGSTSLTPVLDPLKADFRNFLYGMWKFLGLPDPTPVQYDIAKWLQHGPRRAVTMAFRGVGKSWITAAFVLWLLYCNRDVKIMVVSANAVKAAEFTTFALRVVQSWDLLRHLAPTNDQRQSTIAFDVAGATPDPSPSVKSVGITGQLTGSRADVIVPDDIEVPSNSDTQTKRDRILELVKEFDAVLKPAGRILYLGTPQTEQSIYNTLPARGYAIRKWPALYPRVADLPHLAPMIAAQVTGQNAGLTVDPQRFTDQDLQERALSYGRSGFALQFLMDTSLSDADKHPLKLADLIVYPLDPYRAPIDLVWASSPDLMWTQLPSMGLAGDRMYRPAWTSETFAPYEACFMWVDPSGRGTDETAYAIVKLLHGRIFLVASGGFLGGYTDATLKGLLKAAERHHVERIFVEPNFGGGMFTKLLMAHTHNSYHVTVEDAKWANVTKEQRIVDTLEPVMNQHRLVIASSVIENDYHSTAAYEGERAHEYRLIYQLTRMVRQKGALAKDDRIDALAGVVSVCLEHMAQDSELAATAHKDNLLDKELAKFLNHTLSGRNVPSRRMASSTARKVRH